MQISSLTSFSLTSSNISVTCILYFELVSPLYTKFPILKLYAKMICKGRINRVWHSFWIYADTMIPWFIFEKIWLSSNMHYPSLWEHELWHLIFLLIIIKTSDILFSQHNIIKPSYYRMLNLPREFSFVVLLLNIN